MFYKIIKCLVLQLLNSIMVFQIRCIYTNKSYNLHLSLAYSYNRITYRVVELLSTFVLTDMLFLCIVVFDKEEDFVEYYDEK